MYQIVEMTTEESTDVEEPGVTEHAKECLEVNEIVEDIFHLTLNKSPQSQQSGLNNPRFCT